jgi:hypothetical protein
VAAVLLLAGPTASGADAPPGPQPPGAKAAAPAVQELVEALRRQAERLQSLAVDYTIEKEMLVEPAAIKRYMGYSFLPRESKTFVFQGEKKRYYNYFELEKGEPLAPDVETDLDVVLGNRRPRPEGEAPSMPDPKAKRRPFTPAGEILYDGTRLYHRNGFDLIVTNFPLMSDLKDDLALFNQEYLNMTGRALPDLSLKQNSRRSERWYEALAAGDLKLRPFLEEENGCPCVVLERAGQEIIWLDPNLGFATRRWEKFEASSGARVWCVLPQEWTEPEPGLWLPTIIWKELYGLSRVPEPYRGKAMVRQIFTVRSLLVNKVPDVYFTPFAEPGCEVHDWTQLPKKDGKHQVLQFAVPGDLATLDASIDEVRARPNKVVSWGPSLWSVGVPGLGIVAGICLFLAACLQLPRRTRAAVPGSGTLCPRSGGAT